MHVHMCASASNVSNPVVVEQFVQPTELKCVPSSVGSRQRLHWQRKYLPSQRCSPRLAVPFTKVNQFQLNR